MPGTPLRILMARHSAFYSPVIASLAAGFLRAEGLEATYGVLAPGQRARDLLRQGQVDLVQSAVSSSWGQRDPAVHFAQINCRDGFFLTARRPDPAFHWKKLEGAALLADHGGQPLAMLRYAARVNGVDWSRVRVIDAGDVDAIDAAFRAGEGDYVHQQGPGPQQLEHEGRGRVVAAVGASMPPVAFSSLLASRGFLETETARRFLAAYRLARRWVQETPAAEVARAESGFFPEVHPAALAKALACYQKLGCWAGGLPIRRDLYDQAAVVFQSGEKPPEIYPYEEVVAPPPGADSR